MGVSWKQFVRCCATYVSPRFSWRRRCLLCCVGHAVGFVGVVFVPWGVVAGLLVATNPSMCKPCDRSCDSFFCRPFHRHRCRPYVFLYKTSAPGDSRGERSLLAKVWYACVHSPAPLLYLAKRGRLFLFFYPRVRYCRCTCTLFR